MLPLHFLSLVTVPKYPTEEVPRYKQKVSLPRLANRVVSRLSIRNIESFYTSHAKIRNLHTYFHLRLTIRISTRRDKFP